MSLITVTVSAIANTMRGFVRQHLAGWFHCPAHAVLVPARGTHVIVQRPFTSPSHEGWVYLVMNDESFEVVGVFVPDGGSFGVIMGKAKTEAYIAFWV